MAACVLLAAAGARAADDPTDKFIAEIISGAKTNSARAAKLLAAAKVLTDQPKICAAVLEKAIEFGTKFPVTPASCKVVGDAIDLLEAEFPDRKDEWTQKRADACRIKFRCTRTAGEKQAAGRELLAALLAAAEIHEKSGNWTSSAVRYREAVPVDAYLKAGNAEEIRRKLKTVGHFATTIKRVAQYAASLKKDPSKASTRGMLVKLLVVELNDPARAAGHLNEDMDEMWRTYVPLAAKGLDDLDEAVCLELGQWYYKELSKTASSTGKDVSLRRAKSYYEKFVELHTKVDVQAFRAKAALDAIEKELAKLNAPPPIRVSKSSGKVGKTLMLSLGNGVTMKVAGIPAGKFIMSSPSSEKGRLSREGTQRIVTISKPFYIGVTEVTQLQWRAVMSSEPWDGRKNVQSNAQNAASYISWRDVEAFCGRLSKSTGKTVTLPTEAQWEYACRAGTRTAFCFGDDPSKLDSFAWFGRNKKNATEVFAHPVGRKKPNAWGLYDMHGNVYEWCLDWYEDAYATAKNVDPQGPASSRHRTVRGGAFGDSAGSCRSSHRHMYKALDRQPGLGFRIVVLAPARR